MNITGIPPDIAHLTKDRKHNPAEGLERTFLSEMLKHAGPKASLNAFNDASGESPFSSMLNDAYADVISARINLRLLENGWVSP